jgi:superfamily II DNA helicase RecQ
MSQLTMRSDTRTLGMIANLEDLLLFNRSIAPLAINYRSSGRIVSKDKLKRAIQKVLRYDNVIFRSEKQREALYTIVLGNQTTPLVVVLLTSRGKSLLFIALAYLIDPGVTIIVVPYYTLLDNLLKTAKDAGIDCIKYRPRKQNPTALVFVSADFARGSQFLSYI